MNDQEFQVQVVESLTELKVDMKAVKDHLAKLNGSVARHEEELNQTKLWKLEQEHSSKIRLDNKTVLKLGAMVCGTVLVLGGVKIAGLADAIVAFLK